MKGKNLLTLNQATIVQAIQCWIDSEMYTAREGPTVVSVKASVNEHGGNSIRSFVANEFIVELQSGSHSEKEQR